MKRKARKSSAKKLKGANKKATSQGRSRSQAESFLRLNDQVWPMEKDVIYRPDRLKYVRKLLKPEGCVFCAAATSEPNLESLCVYQDETAMIVLNKYPYNPGHVLVLPKRHVGDLQELTEAEFVRTWELVRTVQKALKISHDPAGFNIGINLGSVAGAGIPEHLHIHVVPRWSGDLNFFPLIADTKVLVENLDSTYQRLVDALGRVL